MLSVVCYIFGCVVFIVIAAYALWGKADAILRELKAIRELLEKSR